MNAVDNRLIELVIIGQHRPLRAVEAAEYTECRRFVINRERQFARVMNLMQAARIGKDWDWFEQLTAEYRRLMRRYGYERGSETG